MFILYFLGCSVTTTLGCSGPAGPQPFPPELEPFGVCFYRLFSQLSPVQSLSVWLSCCVTIS